MNCAKGFVFVGGATAGLLITDPAAPSVRPTKDVDVVVDVPTYTAYQVDIAESLRRLGFLECIKPGVPICAWFVEDIRVDVMPTAPGILGFSNSWYTGAVSSARPVELGGERIQVISAPYFIATKLEAFRGRGNDDYYGSHDLEDIVAIVDGRPEIISETAESEESLRSFIQAELELLLESRDFHNALPGHVVDAERTDVVLRRFRALAGDTL